MNINPTALTFSEQLPVQFADKLPDAVDVVVIGGGIIGVCTAYELARTGVRVLLCEKGRVAAEQSSRNWGWIRQLGRDPAELPIMMESSRLWAELAAQLDVDIGFRQQGIIYLASSAKKLAAREAWLAVAAQQPLDVCMLTRAQVDQQIKGGIPGRWVGGIHTPGDARAEPWLAVPAIARAAHRSTALIRENCAVRAIETTNARVTGVVTESGIVRCEQVVLAGGAWSSLFAANMGLRLPQLTVRSTVVATTAVADVYAGCAADEELAFRRRHDGGYTLALTDLTHHAIGPDSLRFLKPFIPALQLDWKTYRFGLPPANFPDAWRTRRRWSSDEETPFERNRVLSPMPHQKAADKMLDRFRQRFPGLKDVAVAHSWAGMIDTMPDIVPVIDKIQSVNGLIIATGFSGHGFGIGPAAGKIVADLVRSKDPRHDLRRFRFSRFADGSAVDPGPAL